MKDAKALKAVAEKNGMAAFTVIASLHMQLRTFKFQVNKTVLN